MLFGGYKFPFLISFVFACAQSSLFAQDTNASLDTNTSVKETTIKPGRILGRVFDADSGEALKDVTVVLEDQNRETKTDLEGRYRLSDIAPGDYSLLFFKENYQRTRVKAEGVVSGRSKLVDLPLNPDYSNLETLDAFEITAEDLAGSDIQLLALRQESMVVMDAMGSFDMSRLGAGNVADALTKMVGTSVQDGKYVVVRGLADRYSNATFNGVPIPSSDVYRNTPQLDLFPSLAVDSISIKKSFSADMNPAFAGGSVDVVTKAYPEEFSLSVSSGFGYNEFSHGEGEYLTYEGGDSDWYGFGLDHRKIPDNLDAFTDNSANGGVFAGLNKNNVTQEKAAEINSFLKQLNKEFVPFKKSPQLDYNLGVEYGDYHELDDIALGTMFSVDFARKTKATPQKFYQDPLWGSGEINQISWNSYESQVGTESAEIGSFAQIVVIPNEENELGLILLYSHTGEKEASYGRMLEEGINGETVETPSGDPASKEIFEIKWEERDMIVSQIYGKHSPEILNDWSLDWRYSHTKVDLDEPDRRVIMRGWKEDEYYGPLRKLSGGDMSGVPSMIWRSMKDRSDFAKIKLESPFKEFDFGFPLETKVSFGGAQNKIERIFDQSQIKLSGNLSGSNNSLMNASDSFAGGVGNYSDGLDVHNMMNETYLGYDPNDLSSPGNVFMFYPETGTPSDYESVEETNAIFGSIEMNLPNEQKAMFGLRQEKLRIETIPKPDIGETLDAVKEKYAFFESSTTHPSISYTKDFANDFKFSSTYGNTMAKPTFRELAFVSTDDPISGRTFKGNPSLEPSLIDNYDARFDWNLSEKEILAVSVFYKVLENPIQQTRGSPNIKIGNESYATHETTFLNSDEAILYGLELEAKISLGRFWEDMDWFKIGSNLTWSSSELTLSDAEKSAFGASTNSNYKETRALEGQSEWIFNFDFSFQNEDLGLTSTLIYSFYDERLESASYNLPSDIWEDAYSNLDFVSSYNFGKNDDWKIKASAKNIIPEVRISRVYGTETIVSKYETPTTFGISLSKDF
jgi:outer membrane receptor protein involved in Fe transport